MRLVSTLLVVFFAFALAGCASRGLSKESVRMADRTISFAKLRENPDQFIGKHVHLGGAIAQVRNYPEGGELEIVEFPLNNSGKPRNDVQSEGRFLARGNRFLDPLIFKSGQLVSLVGEVKGNRMATIDNVKYRYPVIDIRELHTWQPEEYQDTTPRFHFGFGVFKGF